MYSKFPFSMENIPRQKSFACLSLKIGCVLSALIIILYSVLSLAQCMATLGEIAPKVSSNDMESIVTFALVITVTLIHIVTFTLTSLMLVGTLREKPSLMRPWVVWTSVQVLMYLMLFMFSTTMSMVHHVADNSLLLYVLEFLSLLLRFYMLMLVASYYKQLEEELYYGERVKTLDTDYDNYYTTA